MLGDSSGAHRESDLLADPPVGSIGLLDGHCSCWRNGGAGVHWIRLGVGGGAGRPWVGCWCWGVPLHCARTARYFLDQGPEEFPEMVSVRRGWGTQRANPGACSAKFVSARAQGPSNQ